MSNKSSIVFSLVLFLSFVCFSGLWAGDAPPPEVLQAARQGVVEFTQRGVTAEMSRPAAFPGGNGKAVLGSGFPIYTIIPSQMMKCASLDTAAVRTPLWRFVVMSGDRAASLVTVTRVNGKWQAVSIGGAQLADEVTRVMKQWPQSSGYSYRFIRIYQARADFIEISKNSDVIGFVPLSSSRIVFHVPGDFEPGMILYNSEIMPELKRMIKHQHLDSGMETVK